jgi:hypothetical protein
MPASRGGQGHEAQVRPVQLGIVVGALDHVGPDHRVGAAPRGQLLGGETGLGDPRSYRLDVDGATPLHAQFT